MTAFKSIFAPILAITFAFNSVSFALTSNQQQTQRLLRDLETSKKDLSIEEMKQGVHEMRTLVDGLKEDLEYAKIRRDGRLAVKIRRYASLTPVGIAVIAIISDFRSTSPDAGASVIVAPFLLVIAAAIYGGFSGYIYFTSDEVNSLKSSLSKLQRKIEETQRLIARAEAQAR